MSIEDAKAYMLRMRTDPDFKKEVNTLHEHNDSEAVWAWVKDQGYDFSIPEFKQAQQEMSHDPQAG